MLSSDWCTCGQIITLFALLCVQATLLPSVSGLRLTRLMVPSHVDFRDDVDLSCEFDLEGKGLYSVKWYKDDAEFYRYMPENIPEKQEFWVPGVTLNVEASTMTSVRLTELFFNSSGVYRCEVSSEWPNFETVIGKSNMSVLAFLRQEPVIEGAKKEYSLEEEVDVNCTTLRTNPPCDITWIVNGAVAERSLLINYVLLADDDDIIELYTRSLGLRFKTAAHHFMSSGQQMQLRCVATLAARKWQRTVYPVLRKTAARTGGGLGRSYSCVKADGALHSASIGIPVLLLKMTLDLTFSS